MANETYIHKQERYFSAHHDFLRLANAELHEAENKNDFLYDRALIAITFSALAMEAFANAVGKKIIDEWGDFEKLSPFVKIKFLARHLKIECDTGKEPWQTLRMLHKFRNDIAHPKSEQINTEVEHIYRGGESPIPDPPKSDFESRITIEFAKKAHKAMRDLQDSICNAVPEDLLQGLRHDGWTGTGRLSGDPHQ